MVKKRLYPGKSPGAKGGYYISCPHKDWSDYRKRGDLLNQHICKDCECCRKFKADVIIICEYPNVVPEDERDIELY